MVIEIMGKHSNIILLMKKHDYRQYQTYFQSGKFCKRSSTGRTYIAPPGKGKISLNDLSVEWMENTACQTSFCAKSSL